MAKLTPTQVASKPATSTGEGQLASASDEKLKRKINRQRRIQPKAGSFRPGAGVKKLSARTMTFIIPVLSQLGTDDEFSLLRTAAAEIPEHSSRTSVVGMGVDNGEFRLKLRVPSPADGDDDDLVSELFKELQPFYTASPLFESAADVPRWEYSIGDFVADKGTFA